MGSSSSSSGNEESKQFTISDASATEPLLAKSFLPALPTPEPENSQPHDDDDSNSFPPIAYNHGPRGFQDLPFLFLFLLLSLSTIAFGIFSIAHRSPYYSKASSFVYDSSSSSCVFNSSSSFSSPKTLQILSSISSAVSSSSSFLKDLIWVLVITFILSGPFVCFLLWALRHYTRQIVYASLPFFIIVPVFLNVFWFVACTVSSGCRESFALAYRILLLVFVFLVIGVIAWIIVANWHRIELTVRIVGVAAEALARNLGLLGVLPCLSVGLMLYFVPIVVFLVFARLNGRIVPKYSSGESEYYCVWKQDSWVPAYYALAIITMIWSAAAIVEAQVYVIAGTVAQWHFSKEDSKPRRSIRSSLRNAFGPSFGTVCFSGLLICAVRAVRAAVDSAKREDNASGIVNTMLRCCVNVFLAAIDFVNKFTIIFVAITGESYCSSAKMTYELLRRNLLSAVFVETVSTRILIGIIFVLSAIYAIVVCLILKAVSALGMEAYFVGILAWLLLIAILGYFVHVLDNVIDTVYVCYAIDRDKGEVCKRQVHEVYVLLPISRNDRSYAHRTQLIA